MIGYGVKCRGKEVVFKRSEVIAERVVRNLWEKTCTRSAEIFREIEAEEENQETDKVALQQQHRARQRAKVYRVPIF